ncbi:sigma-54-dependent transcriptional regulator [Archangium gephyra]|uniref:sigma-54-dependent transcriptional regulator n=1 Tax=Archangium gephyra TaxID=48 RepID=UPI003B7CC405
MNDASHPSNLGRILVVDAQRNTRAITVNLLRAKGHTVLEAVSGEAALATLAKSEVDLMLTRLQMRPMDGLTLLKCALEVAPHLQVFVMTASGSIESAIESMRLGAFDYVTLPFKDGEMLHRVERALERTRLQAAAEALAQELSEPPGPSALVGRSPAMRELTSLVQRVARSDATVLVQGESGTGKELVARAVHAHSPRKNKPFVLANCASVSEAQLELELFGQPRGARTGAARARKGLFKEADGGTLFLDEVTETAPALQSRLLRTLQDGEVRRVGESAAQRVDVRIIAATHRDIEQEVREKRFRQDLFYCLNVVPLRVPPLRERLEDIPVLAEHFLQRANARGPRPKRLSNAAVERLMGYGFPGNVRELENLVRRAAALAEGEELQPEDFLLPPLPSRRGPSKRPSKTRRRTRSSAPGNMR